MDYLDWQSTLGLDDVFAGSTPYSYPTFLAYDSADTRFVSLSKHPDDNRSVLMLHDGDDIRCVTPSPYALQTRVNEYGGKPFFLCEDSLGKFIVFTNQADQCLYRQSLTAQGLGDVERITKKPSAEQRFMYTDVHQLTSQSYLAIVECEKAQGCHSENEMVIASLEPAASDDSYLVPTVEVQGADFYSNLVVGPVHDKAGVSQQHVAWVQWSHPNMPWDETELWIADLVIDAGNTHLHNARRIDWPNANRNASICQLLFSSNGRLFFSADYTKADDKQIASSHDDYWNVHVYDPRTDSVSKVTQDLAEYGYPHWVYGDKRIVQLDESSLAVIASQPSGDAIVLIDQHSLSIKTIETSLFCTDGSATIQHIDSDGHGQLIFECLAFSENPAITSLRVNNSRVESYLQYVKPSPINFAISKAESMSYNTRDGSEAHGFYYPPRNHQAEVDTKSSSLPPLLVMVHGGPTARAYGHFDLQKQFWTSRGFAILDVNHRGSSGYGREFRDALYGQWGERDASDIADAVLALIEQAKVDPKRVCIRGKSAGGYAVLRALTEYPELFRVGACYYGIGNLLTLAESTHKFEKHYTDRLIDEVFEKDSAQKQTSRFYQRSPIHKLEQLSSAMIVFQGALDKVVPPSVAQEVIAVLKKAKIDHQYVEYANEAHGFRMPANNIDAWQKELDFYQRILRSPND